MKTLTRRRFGAWIALLGLAVAPVACRPGPDSAANGEASVSDDRIRFPEGSRGVNQPEHRDAPYVVMLSMDGFRYDYLELFDTPNLDRIVERGVRADGLIPVFPVKTFPNHYSIATGMYADGHGLVGNSFCEPAFDACYAISNREEVENTRWYGGEPIWVTAETQGMVSSSFFWVGSEAPVMGIQPTEWHRFDPEVAYADRVERVLEWLQQPEESRPHLITFYFEETDSKGHFNATDSQVMKDAVALVDDLIGDLLDGIEALPHGDQVHVIVVSDHGMAPFYADQAYYVPDLVDLGDDVEMVGSGPHSILYVDGDDARTDQLVDALAAAMPHVAVWRVEDVPEYLHYDPGEYGARMGDIVLMPDLGWSVLSWREGEREARDGWTHGWDRRTPEMAGLFVAMGPRIRQGVRIDAFDNVHVYPLVAEILGLEPNPEMDGRLDVLAPILR